MVEVLGGRAAIARRRGALKAMSKHPHAIALLRRGLLAAAQRPDARHLLASIVARIHASNHPLSFKASFVAEVDAIRREADAVDAVTHGLQSGLSSSANASEEVAAQAPPRTDSRSAGGSAASALDTSSLEFEV
jgi:hypothetical protein